MTESVMKQRSGCFSQRLADEILLSLLNLPSSAHIFRAKKTPHLLIMFIIHQPYRQANTGTEPPQI